MGQAKTRAGEAWSKSDKRVLFDSIGVQGWSVVQRKTGGRSKDAVRAVMRREYGSGGITRGSYQLSEAERETGYSSTQLRRAADALNLRWKRSARGGNYLITGDQLEEMAGWLAHDYWSTKLKLYACHECGEREREHFARGFCVACYRRLARQAKRWGLPFCAAEVQKMVQVYQADPRVARLQIHTGQGRGLRSTDLEVLRALCASHS